MKRNKELGKHVFLIQQIDAFPIFADKRNSHNENMYSALIFAFSCTSVSTSSPFWPLQVF